jgi:hypothetical protein
MLHAESALLHRQRDLTEHDWKKALQLPDKRVAGKEVSTKDNDCLLADLQIVIDILCGDLWGM